MLDDPIMTDDAFQALSSTTEGQIPCVVSSSAQSTRRNESRRRSDKDTGPPEVLDDQINRVSNHQFGRRQLALAGKKAKIPLQGDASFVAPAWSSLAMRGIEHSQARAGAGVMFRRWLDAPPSDDPLCCWTTRTG